MVTLANELLIEGTDHLDEKLFFEIFGATKIDFQLDLII